MNFEPVYKVNLQATYDKYQDIAVVTYQSFYNRVVNRKMDVYEALTVPTKKIQTNDELLYTAHENGISKITYRSRKRRGWSPQEAATKPVREKRKQRHTAKPFNDDVTVIKNIIFNFGVVALSKKQKQYIKSNPELFEGVI
ncbi:hypothetical protein [Macrococcus animalis]|uniref:hypothetical protein n=1 Tax=Macrococcus animalis TaxID=3395467 RepID=UPI0039BE6BC8